MLSNKAIIFIFVLAFIVLLGGYILGTRTNHGQIPSINTRKDSAPALFKTDSDSIGIIPQEIALDFRIPVLMYHYVEYVTDERDFLREQINIQPHAFENQIVTLQKAGYTFITMSELAEIVNKNNPTAEKYVAITFDDGYRDFYTDVFPILKKHNVKAVNYIIANSLDKPNYLMKSQLKEIIDSGLVEIGSHTLNHRYLLGIDPETIKKEITESKIQLESEFGIKIVSFAYPYGVFDDEIIQITRDVGYTNAVGTDLGIIANKNNLFSIKRIRPGYNQNYGLTDYLDSL